MKTKRTEKERSVLFKRTEKNGKNRMFFYKEQKRTERTERSFIKNAKERKERNVLLKRTDAQPCVYYEHCALYCQGGSIMISQKLYRALGSVWVSKSTHSNVRVHSVQYTESLQRPLFSKTFSLGQNFRQGCIPSVAQKIETTGL